MRIKLAFIFFVSLTPVFAQVDTIGNVLTFDEAVKIAIENSATLNQEQNNLQAARMQRTTSLAGLGPGVSASFSGSRDNGNSFNSNTGKVVNGINDNISGSIDASLNVFSGFYQINTIRQYSHQLQAQNYLVHRTAQDVINTVSTQYLQVMLDKQLLIIAKENFDALDKQLQLVKEQVELGAKSPVDEYNQETQAKAAELTYVQAEITLNNDKALLVQTLLIDAFLQFDVESPNWDVNTFDNDPLDLETLANRAKQYRGDYLNAVKSAEAQKYSSLAIGGTALPSVGISFSYGSSYNYQHDVSKTIEEDGEIIDNPDYPRPFKEQFTTNNVYKSYGISVSIPIFNGLQTSNNYTQRRIQYRNAKITRNNLEFQIKNDVLRAVRNYEGAKKAYTITTDQLKAAEIAFQLETERYNLGVTNFAEFANANRIYIQAQTDKAQAEYRLVFQKITLEYAVGTLKTENVSMQN